MAAHKLSHLPAGLGWGAETARPTAVTTARPVAAKPLQRFAELSDHWMTPFEAPGMEAPLRPPPGPARRAAEPMRHAGLAGAITAPGGMETLRDVTNALGPPKSCGCGCSEPRRAAPRSPTPARDLRPLAATVCPPGNAVRLMTATITDANLPCIQAAVQAATAASPSVSAFPGCCEFAGDGGAQAHREWHAGQRADYLDAFIDHLAASGCGDLASLASVAQGSDAAADAVRSSFYEILDSAVGEPCNPCNTLCYDEDGNPIGRADTGEGRCFADPMNQMWRGRTISARACLPMPRIVLPRAKQSIGTEHGQILDITGDGWMCHPGLTPALGVVDGRDVGSNAILCLLEARLDANRAVPPVRRIPFGQRPAQVIDERNERWLREFYEIISTDPDCEGGIFDEGPTDLTRAILRATAGPVLAPGGLGGLYRTLQLGVEPILDDNWNIRVVSCY